MSKSVFGIATTQSQAERIIQQLQNEGFATSEISVLMPDTGGTRDVGHVKATKAPEGATTGAAAGGATGGVVGLLAGIGALAFCLDLRNAETDHYEEKLKKGNYLIAVHTDESEDVDRAKHIFKTVGAEDISTVSEASAPKV
jgi:hypothetical protein